MTHDPMCPLNERCNADHVEHGFCSWQSTFCIHCERECRCEEYARVREDERGALYADPDRDPVAAYNRGYAAALRDAAEAVRGRKGRYNERWPNTHAAFREAIAAIEALGGER